MSKNGPTIIGNRKAMEYQCDKCGESAFGHITHQFTHRCGGRLRLADGRRAVVAKFVMVTYLDDTDMKNEGFVGKSDDEIIKEFHDSLIDGFGSTSGDDYAMVELELL